MRYLHSMKDFLLTESMLNKILYHGSPYNFDKFKNNLTFFSDSEKFALEYAQTKSMDYALDADPIIYKVKVNCDVFDINNKVEYEKLKNILPNEIEYAYNNFGFTTKIKKEDLLFNMTGFDIDEPLDEIKNKKVGDTFDLKIAMSQYETYKLYKKDNEYIYGYKLYDVNYILDFICKDNWSKSKYKNIINDVENYVKEYAEKDTGKKYISEGHLQMYLISFYKGGKGYLGINDIPENYVEEFNNLYEEATKKAEDYVITNKNPKKFLLKPKTIELKNTWRYYENETVTNAIFSLGFGGYVAKEDGENTYAIFNPNKDVTIIDKY